MPTLLRSEEYDRFDLKKIKSQIVHVLGHDTSDAYFNNLTNLLSERISHNEFQRFCNRSFGPKYIALHNNLLRSVIKNAVLAKTPPPGAAARDCARKTASQENGVCISATKSRVCSLSNGDDILTSSRKILLSRAKDLVKEFKGQRLLNWKISPKKVLPCGKDRATKSQVHPLSNGDILPTLPKSKDQATGGSQARQLSNGNTLSSSPKIALSPGKDQKINNFLSAISSAKQKPDVAVNQGSGSGDGVLVGNGTYDSYNLKRWIQIHEDGDAEQPKKRICADGISPCSVDSKQLIQLPEDGNAGQPKRMIRAGDISLSSIPLMMPIQLDHEDGHAEQPTRMIRTDISPSSIPLMMPIPPHDDGNARQSKKMIRAGDVSPSARPLKKLIQLREDGVAEQPRKRIQADSISPYSIAYVKGRSLIEEVAAQEPCSLAFVNGASLTEEVAAEKVDYATHGTLSDYKQDPIRTPYGMPFYSPSVYGHGESSSWSSAKHNTNFRSSNDEGELCDTEELRKRMEKIAADQGLDGVSIASANLLNAGLDAYLKRLIKPCVDMVKARTGNSACCTECRPLLNGKVRNRVLPRNQTFIHGNNGTSQTVCMQKNFSVSLNDFKISVIQNRMQVGHDYPSQLEKITARLFEELD